MQNYVWSPRHLVVDTNHPTSIARALPLSYSHSIFSEHAEGLRLFTGKLTYDIEEIEFSHASYYSSIFIIFVLESKSLKDNNI
jgi:hypothetical protein